MNDWVLDYDHFEPRQEGLREALCTLGNGYFASRGAAPEARADDVHYPGSYLAGGYNRLVTHIAGADVENEDLVNLPNWLVLSFRIGDGPWFDLRQVTLLHYRQRLHLYRGILTREIRFEDEAGRRTRLRERRFVHMGHMHLAGLETRIAAENWQGSMEVHVGLDGTVTNSGVPRYRDLNGQHLEAPETWAVDTERMALRARTAQSRLEIAEAARVRLYTRRDHGARLPMANTVELEETEGAIAQRHHLELAQDQTVEVEKIVALYTTRDNAVSETALEASKAVARAGSFDQLLDDHINTWQRLWRRFGIEVESTAKEAPDATNQVLRLHIFHLLQTASSNSMQLDAGVPARGLHGEAYRGHIFWDELFIFPLLNLRVPEITRALLLYRYRRLGEARAAARAIGYLGAMYPWQSGSDGREESQQLHLNPRSGRWLADNSHLQRHVNIAIAYNIWQYYEVTQDSEFMSFYGAEMLMEIARFWTQVATYNRSLDRYEIHGVMGPDEYHDRYPDAGQAGLNNNAYTNVMAAWVICRALQYFDSLWPERRTELKAQLGLGSGELELWRDISRKMRVVYHDEGIISQFEGYGDLQEFDWEGYAARYGDIQRLDRILEAEGDSPNNYKASKQADVLMLFYLLSADELGELFARLGYPFDAETIPRNVDYYLQRTAHGSTLSRVVHAWVLARTDRARSWELFSDALRSDVADVQGGTTQEGIHLGAMAGTVDLIQRCYTGIETRRDALWLNPALPDVVRSLSMRLSYRGHPLDLTIDHERVTVTLREAVTGAVPLVVNGRMHEVEAGETRTFTL